MKFLMINKSTKVNKLDYTTFELDEFSDGDFIEEEQNVNISAKSGVSKSDDLSKVFLFDVFIQGKSEDTVLREFHLDVFFEFSFSEDYNESEDDLLFYMYSFYLKKIQKVITFVSGIDQSFPFSIQERIEEIEKDIKEKNLDVRIEDSK